MQDKQTFSSKILKIKIKLETIKKCPLKTCLKECLFMYCTSADSQPTKLRGLFFWFSVLTGGEEGGGSLMGGNRLSCCLIITVISFWIWGVAVKKNKHQCLKIPIKMMILQSPDLWGVTGVHLMVNRDVGLVHRRQKKQFSPFIMVKGSSIWGLSRLIPITVAKFSTFILLTLEWSCTSNKNLSAKIFMSKKTLKLKWCTAKTGPLERKTKILAYLTDFYLITKKKKS